MVKQEIRVIGIDDAPFDKFKRGNVLVVGTIFRGGSFIDGVLSTKVKVDGDDSTKRISDMINICRFKPQLQCIFLDGIAVGGLNIIDIDKLSKSTSLPIIVIMRKIPNTKEIIDALIKLNKKDKIKLIEKAGEIKKINDIFVQLKNIDSSKAKEILNIVCTRSNIPEPLRVSHIIASGIVKGESKGRA